MYDAKRMAERVMVLVSDGMTQEEALMKVLNESSPTTKDNRLEWIQTVDNIELLQKTAHRAHAKKSKYIKNDGKMESIERFQAEINACNARVKILKAKADESAAKIPELIKLGAKPSTIVQAWIKDWEDKVNPKLDKAKDKHGLSNKALKQSLLKTSTDIPKSLIKELKGIGDQYLDNVVERHGRGDQRIIALMRKINFVRSSG